MSNLISVAQLCQISTRLTSWSISALSSVSLSPHLHKHRVQMHALSICVLSCLHVQAACMWVAGWVLVYMHFSVHLHMHALMRAYKMTHTVGSCTLLQPDGAAVTVTVIKEKAPLTSVHPSCPCPARQQSFQAVGLHFDAASAHLPPAVERV